MERLLAYQGPVVHVDHSHRAPRPTGRYLRTVVECEFYLVYPSKVTVVPYTLSSFDRDGLPIMTMDDLQAVADKLYELVIPDGNKAVNDKDESVFDKTMYKKGKAVNWYELRGLVVALETGWHNHFGPKFTVMRHD